MPIYKLNNNLINRLNTIGNCTLLKTVTGVNATFTTVELPDINNYKELYAMSHRTASGSEYSYQQVNVPVGVLKTYPYGISARGFSGEIDIKYFDDSHVKVRCTDGYSSVIYIYGIE